LVGLNYSSVEVFAMSLISAHWM